MEIKERIQFLIQKLENKAVTIEELDELLSVLKSEQNGILLSELQISSKESDFESVPDINYEEIYREKINAVLQTDRGGFGKLPGKKKFYNINFFKYAAAACILFVFLSLFVSRINPSGLTKKIASVQKTQPKAIAEIRPGSNRATLLLSDGTKIALDTLSKGHIANQGSTSISKQDDGKIVYQATKEPAVAGMFNTMSTPNGGQYQLVLPDGTRVWMNAASTIKYPVRFEGKERRVEVEGELYFEVSNNPRQPFIVDAGNGSEIKVLGTHFNVNTYKNEKYIRATLLEGLIRVTSKMSDKMLRPGEQAQIDDLGKLGIQQNVDMKAVMAWKNGLFNFNRSNTHEIMNQLSRWYDIKIKYEGPVSDQIYGGEMQRDLNLSQVLKILQKSGMHCMLDQRVLIVRP